VKRAGGKEHPLPAEGKKGGGERDVRTARLGRGGEERKAKKEGAGARNKKIGKANRCTLSTRRRVATHHHPSLLKKKSKDKTV